MRPTSVRLAPGAAPPSPIVIEHVEPAVDSGRYPVKREVGDVLTVSADIFREGHDKLAAMVKYRRWQDTEWRDAEMHFVDNDRWEGSFALTENVQYIYTVEAFPDYFETWRDEIGKKHEAGLDVALELREGLVLLEDVLARADNGDDTHVIRSATHGSSTAATQAGAIAHMVDPQVVDVVNRYRSRKAAIEFTPFRKAVSYTHLRAHETVLDLVCRLLLEK